MSKKDNKRKRFGKYLMLDHLVDGGMARVYRARYLGEEADKLVAIKVIREQFSKDEAFKQMFVDEVKASFAFSHPNIIQTYDYGIYDNQLYVAMEYCDGRNLKDYIGKLKKKNFVFPIDVAIYITTQACQGLNYAHKFTDKLTGKELNLIHRDISPSNIMLTFDGSIKVIDFGIAKSDNNSGETQAGTIKGKMSYLAPEYLEGLELDHRYDQFAVGITLWEMLCGRKLFTGANDLAILKSIQECKVPPPSSINKNVPKELDEIILKSLNKDRNKRYENLDQLNRSLSKFLYSNFPDFNSSDVAYFAKELFAKEIEADHKKLFEFGKIDIKPFIKEWKQESEGSGKLSGKGLDDESTITNKKAGAISRKERTFALEKNERLEKTLERSVSSPIRKKFGPAGMGVKEPGENSITRKESSGLISGHFSEGNSSITNSRISRKTKLKKKPRNFPFVATIAILLGGFFFKDEILEVTGFQKTAREVATEFKDVESKAMFEDKEKEGFGKITLGNYNRYKQLVYINGKQVRPDIFSTVEVTSGEENVVRVESRGKRPFVMKIRIKEGATKTIVIPEQPVETFVRMVSQGSCKSGILSLMLYGEVRKIAVPLEGILINLPIGGDQKTTKLENGSIVYVMHFKPDGTQVEKKIKVKIEPSDSTVNICDFF